MGLSELVYTYPTQKSVFSELHVRVPLTTAEQPAEDELARGDSENGPRVGGVRLMRRDTIRDSNIRAIIVTYGLSFL